MLNYQNDANTLTIDDEFMVGSDLLAAPILQPGPDGAGWSIFPKEHGSTIGPAGNSPGGAMIHAEAPLETVPLFVRGGAIIPMGPEMNYVGEKTGPLTFTIYPDAKGLAGVSLYEDDGVSLAYPSGAVRRTAVTYQASAAGAVIDVSAPTGSYQPGARDLVFVVRGAPGTSR